MPCLPDSANTCRILIINQTSCRSPMISRGEDNRFAGSIILKRDTGRGHLARFHYQSHGNTRTRFGQIMPQLRIILLLALYPSWPTKLPVAPGDRLTLPLRSSSQNTCANPDHVLLMWFYKRIISYASTGLSVSTLALSPSLTEPDPESKSGDEARPFYSSQENEANTKSAQRIRVRVSIVS